MILRAAAAIARFFGQIGKDAFHSLPTVGKWLDDIIRWPFSLVLGGSPPLPSYEPNVMRSDIINEFKKARRATAVEVLGRDIVATVRKFCAAAKAERDTMDLPGVDTGVMALLLTMDDNELRALLNASDPAIRKFSMGRKHGIHGVPALGVHYLAPANARASRPSLDHRRWKEQAELLRNIEDRFKVG